MRAPISYYGGKGYMYKHIIGLFPPHQTYVEPFGGAAWVLLNKPPSSVEVYNDVDGDVVNLFRVLRDQGKELQRLLQLTPYAREEFMACSGNHCEEPVERARRTFVQFRQAFNSHRGTTPGSWSYNIGLSRRGIAKSTSQWLSLVDEGLPLIMARLRMVQIECLDFVDIIPRYDTPDTLFYCDPPYMPEARADNRSYTHEMTTAQHAALLDLLLQVKGRVVLSGYHSELYDKKLDGWWYLEKEVSCHASGQATTRDGKGGKAPRRTEVVWLNPAAVEANKGKSLL